MTRREKEAGLLRKRHGAGDELKLLRQQRSPQESRNASSNRPRCARLRGSLQPWRTVLKQQKYRKQAGGQKKGIMALAETTNKDSHINTSLATAVQTSSAAVTANRQAEDNVPPTLLQPANPPPFPGRIHSG
ncbi:hypothetical protein NDU88_000881 [Pleurodeles waltl]|uniref:Uncharacterized protein n=1 Tax=Pleurodeles waltl TaxID=8319 RepID=A0AAV7TGA4_PLEWA|nr:hypothetical protein NDU88_000881 [Pleurodeles waltl]